MSENFGPFVADRTALALPVQSTDLIPVVRANVTYQIPAVAGVPGSYVYAVPTNGATETAVTGQTKYQFNPAGALTTLNVVLPNAPVDGQTFEIRSSQDITTLNVTAPGGTTVNGSGFTLGGGGSLSYLYVQSVNTWFVG